MGRRAPGRVPLLLTCAAQTQVHVVLALLLVVFACALASAAQPQRAYAVNTYFDTSAYDRNLWRDHADTSWYTKDKGAKSYQISSAKELAGLAVLVTEKQVTFEDKTVNLVADVDLKGHQWFPIGCNEDNYWGLSPFRGVFDGHGHTIKNLYIENGWHGQALFGQVRDAVLKNFTVRGSVTTGWQAAGVVAEMERTTLENITNYADVKTLFKSGDGGYASTAGGIVAYVVDVYVTRSGATPSRMVNLKNYGSVEIAGITEQGGGVGGIAGSLLVDDDKTIVISQCENHGSVHAKASNYVDVWVKGAGGIVGSTATYGNYQITDCSNTGDVSSANLASTGGIAGSISGLESSVSYCYNAGSINGASTEDVSSAGGIVGRSVAAHSGNTLLDIMSCYNVGTVTSNGGNVSAIIGTQSGYGEDWGDNAGGTTVNNISNYYAEDSVQTTSDTGVLFQQGTVEAAQPVSRDRLNSQEVIDELNATDAEMNHYVAGKASPKLELKSSADMGLDSSSTKGNGEETATSVSEDNPAQQKETHMYAVSMDPQDQGAFTLGPVVTFAIALLALLAALAAGFAVQFKDYRTQKKPTVLVMHTPNR